MSIVKSEAERPPTQQNLVKKYRPIGPAAVAAAVAAMKKRKPKTADGTDATSLKRPASSVRRRANRH